jgi:hypothetical protein
MEAKRIARKIEVYFFTKEYKLKSNIWLGFQEFVYLNEGVNKMRPSFDKAINQLTTILDTLGVKYKHSVVKEMRTLKMSKINVIEISKKEYNKIKDFITEYRKFREFDKRFTNFPYYDCNRIINLLSDNIYCTYEDNIQ